MCVCVCLEVNPQVAAGGQVVEQVEVGHETEEVAAVLAAGVSGHRVEVLHVPVLHGERLAPPPSPREERRRLEGRGRGHLDDEVLKGEGPRQPGHLTILVLRLQRRDCFIHTFYLVHTKSFAVLFNAHQVICCSI